MSNSVMLLVVKTKFMIERTNLHKKKKRERESSGESRHRKKVPKEDCRKRIHLRNQNHSKKMS